MNRPLIVLRQQPKIIRNAVRHMHKHVEGHGPKL